MVKKQELILIVPLLVLGISVFAYYFSQPTYPNQYWRGSNVAIQQDAPDGWYEVLNYHPNIPLKNNTLYCPLCPSSGSELHGEWKVKEGLELKDSTWYRVRLENNVIVEAEELYVKA